jgi:hypothetical protein
MPIPTPSAQPAGTVRDDPRLHRRSEGTAPLTMSSTSRPSVHAQHAHLRPVVEMIVGLKMALGRRPRVPPPRLPANRFPSANSADCLDMSQPVHGIHCRLCLRFPLPNTFSCRPCALCAKLPSQQKRMLVSKHIRPQIANRRVLHQPTRMAEGICRLHACLSL